MVLGDWVGTDYTITQHELQDKWVGTYHTIKQYDVGDVGEWDGTYTPLRSIVCRVNEFPWLAAMCAGCCRAGPWRSDSHRC